jgi:hypothetical protein
VRRIRDERLYLPLTVVSHATSLGCRVGGEGDRS